MAVTLKVGVPNKYFEMNGKLYQCGKYDYSILGGIFKVWKEEQAQRPIVTVAIAEVLDGDASNAPFANEAAIKTWLGANFFF